MVNISYFIGGGFFFGFFIIIIIYIYKKYKKPSRISMYSTCTRSPCTCFPNAKYKNPQEFRCILLVPDRLVRVFLTLSIKTLKNFDVFYWYQIALYYYIVFS